LALVLCQGLGAGEEALKQEEVKEGLFARVWQPNSKNWQVHPAF
jgi:hypothetical protein